MEVTFGVLPRTAALQKRAKLPIVANVAPCARGVPDAPLAGDELARCRVCHAFLTGFCEARGGAWVCGICGNENSAGGRAIEQLQCGDFAIRSVKSAGEGAACAVFLSTAFAPQDFVRAKLACISLLQHIPAHRKCIAFIGTDRACFEILVPPRSESELADSCSCQRTQGRERAPCSMAAIAKFSSVETLIGVDLGNLFFTKDNVEAAAKTIEKLKCGEDARAAVEAVEISATLSRVLNGAPLHFVSIVDQIDLNPSMLESIHSFPTRIDFLVSKYTKSIQQIYKEVQGTIQIISKENPVLQAEQIMKQKTSYRLFSTIRCSRAGVQWKKTPKPFSHIENSSLYVPVCLSEYQSYPFEITLLPNQECYNFQVVSKFITEDGNNIYDVMSVMSRSIKSSDVFDEVINNINWNNVLWNWSFAIQNYPQNYALKSIYNASSIILKEHKNEKFIHAITTFIDLYITSNDPVKRLIGTDLLLYMSPSILSFIPTNPQDKMYIISPNGIFTNNPNLNVDEIPEVLPVYLPINNYIPNYITTPNEKQLEIIESLIKKK